MLPIAPLMIEHRLIEKIIPLLARERDRLKAGGEVDRAFNKAAVDFFRVYADKTHHGKEERILFRELGKKDLSPGHRAMIETFESEHAFARERVATLLAADTAEAAALSLNDLIDLYPRHIAREDKEFFIPAMKYFSGEEKAAMLKEGEDFDRSMIHEKYRDVISGLERQRGGGGQ